MGTPDTVTEAIAMLREAGYTSDFELIEGSLCTGDRHPVCLVGEAEVDRLYRFEGPSDPGDQMIVFALHDARSGIRGTLAAAYGPAADPDIYAHLADLSSRFG